VRKSGSGLGEFGALCRGREAFFVSGARQCAFHAVLGRGNDDPLAWTAAPGRYVPDYRDTSAHVVFFGSDWLRDDARARRTPSRGFRAGLRAVVDSLRRLGW